jgi:putrescine aminotransferase
MSFIMGCGVQGAGSGSYVTDEHGRTFLAMFDQYGNQSFGYSNERIVAAIRHQLDSGRLNSTKIMFEEEQIRLTERLAELTGNRLPFAYLANSGGETIDNALKLARAATGRPAFITAVDCFHGKTFAALSASGRPEHAALFRPFMEHFRQVPFGDLAALEAAIGPDTAAVLLEPVQAEGGVIVPAPGYLREVRRLCSAAGALLIFDEMQTAFGRCGTFFAFEQFELTPDLVCIGKAFGGGILPISAVLGTEAVWESIKAMPSTFGSSLGGNPLSCRAGLEAIAIASEDSFLRGVRAKSGVIDRRLSDVAARFPALVRAHRGLGMMYGLEFREESIGGLVLRLLLRAGVMSTYSLYNNRVLRIQPPMVISDHDLARGLDVLADVLATVSAYLDGQPGDGAAEIAFVTRDVRLAHDAEHVRSLLRSRPHLLDPFAWRPDQRAASPALPEFEGTLGDDVVMWADQVTVTDVGVTLSAEPCWLWRSLQRTVAVQPLTGGGCVVAIQIEWDAGCGVYEGLLSGPICAFVADRLPGLIRDLRLLLQAPLAAARPPEPQPGVTGTPVADRY